MGITERGSEKEFQQAVRDLAKLRGWMVWCTWNSLHGPAGEPDLRMVRPPRVIFAELKTEKGLQAKIMSMAQLAEPEEE